MGREPSDYDMSNNNGWMDADSSRSPSPTTPNAGRAKSRMDCRTHSRSLNVPMPTAIGGGAPDGIGPWPPAPGSNGEVPGRHFIDISCCGYKPRWRGRRRRRPCVGGAAADKKGKSAFNGPGPLPLRDFCACCVCVKGEQQMPGPEGGGVERRDDLTLGYWPMPVPAARLEASL
jgi:hypothetical protein